MHKREYGQEQPGIKLGMFVIRIPFIHYRWEVSEFLQALIMCATCLGAIPILTDVLKIPFELAWSMVIINGFLYTLHSTLGDPVVPGWITPSIPLTLVYLNAIPEGEQRIRALIALQILVGIIFVVMGLTGIAGKLLGIVPESIKSGILLGAGIAAVTGQFKEGGNFDKFPITFSIGVLAALFLLFSDLFKDLRKGNKILEKIGGYGMLPAIILSIVVGPLFDEFPAPKIELFPIFKIPDFMGIIHTLSPFGVGFPSAKEFISAIPMAIVVYIIAFGDFVTSEALLNEADEMRPDEKINFDANRSNLISGIRNITMGLFTPYPPLCGPLWAAITTSVAERYKEGPDKMESIFSGVGTFRWTSFIAVALTPIVTLVQPILPAATALTLLVQGFVCVRLAIETADTHIDRGIAGIIGAIIVVRGASIGLAAGILLHLILSKRKKKDSETSVAKA